MWCRPGRPGMEMYVGGNGRQVSQPVEWQCETAGEYTDMLVSNTRLYVDSKWTHLPLIHENLIIQPDWSLPIGDGHILGIFIQIGLHFNYLFGVSMCVKQVWLRLHWQSNLQLFKLQLWHRCCRGSQRVRDVEWCRSFMAGALTGAELKQWLWVTVLISFRLSGHTSDKLKPFTAAPCPGRWM